MPDRTVLRPGDRIRLVSVPAGDLAQRDRELAERSEDAGWTANTLERIIAQQTGHRSMAVLRRYIRHGELFRQNAAGLVGL